MRKSEVLRFNLIDAVRGYVDGRHPFEFHGLLAYLLVQLMMAEERGCTPGELGLLKSSGRISRLRDAGFVIETRYVNDPGSGRRGLRRRYVLRSKVTVTQLELRKALRHA